MIRSRVKEGPAAALLTAFVLALPGSLALANEISQDDEPVAVIKLTEEAVSADAVEELVDQGVAEAEMAPSTLSDVEALELATTTTNDQSPRAPRSDDDDEPPASGGTPPSDLPLQHAPLASISPAMSGGAAVSIPAPGWAPHNAWRAFVLDERPPARPDLSPSKLRVTSHVTPVVAWLRTHAPSSRASADDDHSSIR